MLEGWAGDLYGIPVESTIDAIRLTGRLEGMIIDPVYEGKSMAGLIDLVRHQGYFTGVDGALRPSGSDSPHSTRMRARSADRASRLG